ncbi:hypothetical protein [Mongoliibacter ruber]|uniref:hypothetical protein n=1 Tax=Mongoliibacter ruber TaxID=1750599 RepID=UPI0011B28BF7|nr:hypothetical protein [Mongoliibacter ruber]
MSTYSDAGSVQFDDVVLFVAFCQFFGFVLFDEETGLKDKNRPDGIFLTCEDIEKTTVEPVAMSPEFGRNVIGKIALAGRIIRKFEGEPYFFRKCNRHREGIFTFEIS